MESYQTSKAGVPGSTTAVPPVNVFSAFYQEALLFFSKCLGSVLYVMLRYVVGYRKAVITRNFAQSFPGKSPAEVRKLVNIYYAHMSDLVIEPFLFYLAPARLRSRLAIYTNPDLLENLFQRQKQLLLLASHYANWEYLINLPEVTRYPVYTAYTPMSNARLDGLMMGLRSFLGVTLIPKSGFYRKALSLLRHDTVPKMLVIIADQRPAPGNDKFRVPFLGQSTAVQTGSERLAASPNVEVLYLQTIKKARFKYEFTFLPMEDCAPDVPMSITKAYYRNLEQNIALGPSYWLWSHNRWK